jgi:hypothetical protein
MNIHEQIDYGPLLHAKCLQAYWCREIYLWESYLGPNGNELNAIRNLSRELEIMGAWGGEHRGMLEWQLSVMSL